MTVVPECRDFLEQDELVTPTSAPQAANFGPNQFHHRIDNEQRYLEAFWECVHPAWPILYRPSFDSTRASPLLKAAVITLGAHSTGIPIDSGNACILHKRCLKVIRKRTIDQSHSYRIDDMRAIFLVELFAITRSRRPPLQVSKPFVDSYHHLAREHDTDTTNAFLATINSFDSLHHETPGTTCTFQAESTQRLLTAFYILDRQHSTFFGREATEIPDFDPATFSLPQPLHLWDMTFTPQTAYYSDMHCEHFIPQPLLPQAVMNPRPANELDIFTSMLLIAYAHTMDQGTQSSPSHSTPTPTSYSHSPHIQLAQQTFNLSAVIPVRALLAVAGESWIQGEKLGSKADYNKAQADIRRWATTSNTATIALPLAIEILRLHRLHPRTTFLFHEWSLHLAVLVVWAMFYAGRDRDSTITDHRTLRLSIPISAGTSSESAAGVVAVSGLELDGLIAGLANGGAAGAGIEWQVAKRLLMWAKGRMDKAGIARLCGVVSGAVNVLAALVERGDEDEPKWF